MADIVRKKGNTPISQNKREPAHWRQKWSIKTGTYEENDGILIEVIKTNKSGNDVSSLNQNKNI